MYAMRRAAERATNQAVSNSAANTLPRIPTRPLIDRNVLEHRPPEQHQAHHRECDASEFYKKGRIREMPASIRSKKQSTGRRIEREPCPHDGIRSDQGLERNCWSKTENPEIQGHAEANEHAQTQRV